MNETAEQPALIILVCKVLYFLLPLPVSWLSISLMVRYVKYYDIGVNSSANSGFIFYFILPIFLVILYVVEMIGLLITNRLFILKFLGCCLAAFWSVVLESAHSSYTSNISGIIQRKRRKA